MTSWTDAEWLATAHDWIGAELERGGRALTGPIEQPHVRPWSTAMRVPTDRGLCWFKANIPRLAYEARVVEIVARVRPQAGPELLAVHPEHGWILTADGGTRLRELIAQEQDLRRWLDVLPIYAELQLAMAPLVDELIASGVPDRRLDVLPDQFEGLLERDLGLSADEMRRLHDLRPWVREACAELSGLPIPETIQHDDLHDGQVFLCDGRYLISDWNDACISHPFFSMSVALEGQLQWGFDDIEGSVDTDPFRDAYLEPFTGLMTRAALRDAMVKALRLGWVDRGLTYASATWPPDVDADPEAPGVRLQMFLKKMTPRG
jgi:hypothetical protein